jgi:predicted nucleic acid-binding protein
MVYFDTSFLAPLLLEEATSDTVERFIAGLPAGSLAVSHWTRVEFASLLAREVRMGGLDAVTAREVDAEFEAIVAESFVVLVPGARDYVLARQYLGHHDSGLGAGDALHLAIAQNNRAEAFYTFDKTLLRAGRPLGLPMSIGIAGSRCD